LRPATATTPTPALWSALLLSSALCLSGCSLLPRADQPTTSDIASTTASDGAASFDVVVRAPDAVRETLERHLELQRFRQLPDLQANELQRLLGATDANARELLGTLGYFAPTITVELTEAQETAGASKAPHRTVTVTVDPGPPTRIASADITVAGDADSDSDSLARQQQRLQRNWSLTPGQPFTQSAWDNAKADGLRQLQARRYPTARIANSRAEIDADRHEAQLGVSYDPGPAYRFGPLRGAWHACPRARCMTRQKCWTPSCAWPAAVTTTPCSSRSTPKAPTRRPPQWWPRCARPRCRSWCSARAFRPTAVLVCRWSTFTTRCLCWAGAR
jgi:translocation and assembly module TamA